MCNVNEKGAVDFLLYSYFGITIKDEKDDIIDAAINKAYRDATNQGAFNTLFGSDDKTKDKVKKEQAKHKIDSAKDKTIKYLKDWIKATVMQPLMANDKWHKNICTEVWKKFPEDLNKEAKKTDTVKLRGNRVFSYGNAQKWINMTLKNLYIISAVLLKYPPMKWDEEDKLKWETLYNNAKYFHIPIDNYILQVAFESNESEQNPKCFDDKSESMIWIRKVDKTTYKIKFPNKKDEYSWSQIPDYEEYLKVQNVLLHFAGENPLVWENDKWTEIAKKRKNDKKNAFASKQE